MHPEFVKIRAIRVKKIAIFKKPDNQNKRLEFHLKP
jgi:hypothetical protein